MSIRNDKGEWTAEAKEFSHVIKEVLMPIFNEYKTQFSFEDMYYLVCTEFHDIILDEVLGCKLVK